MVEVKGIIVNNTVTLRIKAVGPVLTFDPVGDKMPLLFLPEGHPSGRGMGQIQKGNSGNQHLPRSLRPVTHVISCWGIWGPRFSDELGSPSCSPGH